MALTRVSAGLLFADDFTRANGAPGANWSAVVGAWDIFGNSLRIAGPTGVENQIVCVGEALTMEKHVQVTVTRSTLSSNGSLAIRRPDAGNYYLGDTGGSSDGVDPNKVRHYRYNGGYGRIGGGVSPVPAPAVGVPSRITMSSLSVIHSVWIDNLLGSRVAEGTQGNQRPGRSMLDAFFSVAGTTLFNNFIACRGRRIVVNGLPTGYKVRAAGGAWSEPATRGAFVRADPAGAAMPFDVDVADAGGTIVETFNGAYGGDHFEYASAIVLPTPSGRLRNDVNPAMFPAATRVDGTALTAANTGDIDWTSIIGNPVWKAAISPTGMPAARVTNGSQGYYIPRPAEDDWTMYLVVKNASGNGAGAQFYQNGSFLEAESGGVVNDYGMTLRSDGKLVAGTGGDVSATGTHPINDGGLHIIVFQRTKATGRVKVWVDDILDIDFANNTNTLNVSPWLFFGSGAAAARAGGDMLRHFTWDVAHSDAERLALTAGLRAVYVTAATLYSATGSGGVHVGGTAPVMFRRAMAATGSGGVSVAGTAAIARGYGAQGSGGVIVSGGATPAIGRGYQGSGGVRVGGSALVSTSILDYEVLGVRDYTGTGIVGDREPGGAETGEVVEREGASGVIVPRAEGAMGAKKSKPAHGGGRTVVQHFLHRGTGRIIVGGTAEVGFIPSGSPVPPVPQVWIGTGGVALGGSAAVSVNIARHYQGFSHGGVAIAGSAPASRNNIPLPTAHTVFGSGGVRVSGSAPSGSTSAQHFGRVGTGGVRVSGVAPASSTIRKRYTPVTGGLILVRGTAPVSRVINAPGGGSGAFTTPVAPATFDTTRNPAHFTSEIAVASMADLQAKLNTVPAGTRLRIPLGVDWAGSVTLPARGFTGTQWVEIAPDLDHAVLEAARPYGRRMNPGIAASLNLPTLRSPGANQSIFYSAFAAQGYRLTGLNFRNGGSCTALVRLGNTDATSASQIGKRMVVDRCTAISGTTFWTNRAFYLCGEQMAVLGTWCADIYGSADAQSILIIGWPGPYIVRWNRLEGWTENLMSGGGEIAAGGVPSDLTIEYNHFTKNLAYRFASPFGNSVKNLIEFKSAIRVRARYNIFEYMWKDGQPFPANFKSVNQSGDPSQVQQQTKDVEFAYNWLRDVSGGFNLGANPEGAATPMERVYIHDNLLERINVPGSNFRENGIMVQLLGALSNVTLDHNTFVKGSASGVSAISMEGSAVGPIALRSNIIQMQGYPLKRTDSSVGVPSWNAFVPSAANRIWQQNVAVGVVPEYQDVLPAGTILRDSDALVGYADLAGGDYTVSGALATAGHDGLPVGVIDMPGLKAALLDVPNG